MSLNAVRVYFVSAPIVYGIKVQRRFSDNVILNVEIVLSILLHHSMVGNVGRECTSSLDNVGVADIKHIILHSNEVFKVIGLMSLLSA